MRRLNNRIRKWAAILTVVCILSSLVSVNVYASMPSDISGHWAQGTIQHWVDQGAIKGYEDGNFRPENRISRAEFMSLVNGIFGYTDTSNVTFTDVKTDAWYATSVEKAANAGYINGYPDGTMRPEDSITREEVASVLMKINELDGNEAVAGVFTDSKAENWSKGAIGAVYSAEIMAGYPDGSFNGKNNIKRCEALVALNKAILRKMDTSTEKENGVNYIALGDSLAYGSKVAKGFGYVDLFYNGLKEQAKDIQPTLLNLGKPGKNSSELLAELKTDKTTIDAVLKADVITISIGGNNLLGPVKTGISTEFKLNTKSSTFDRDLARMLVSKANRDKLKTVLTGLAPELNVGVKQFAKDWPEIVKTVKELSPQAEIIVMTVYNPIHEGEAYFATFNKPISKINAVINASSKTCKVADVYNAFNNYTGAEVLTNFNLLKGSFDVHPTLKGYEEIYKCHE